MKHALLCILVICTMQALNAQDKTRDVFPNGGGSTEISAGSVSFTLGQSVTQTLEGGTFTITQGFQQVDKKGTVGTIDLVKDGEYHIYPNPNTGDFTVDIISSESISGCLDVMNSIGQRIDNRILKDIRNSSIAFNYSNLVEGIYHVVFTSTSGQILFNQKLLITN